jgi:tRNA nucleotidyltransferase (CCA-adding enzyme)
MNYLEKGLEVLKLIESHGYEAYIIGGAVRDNLLGVLSNDVDICTNASIDELSKMFDNIILNGNKYLSITIRVDNYDFEVTHFRRDVSYENHRHPVVEKTDSLQEDMVRRDFTMNAIALNSNLEYIDLYNGKNDIEKKIIRIIGNPDIRFDEDVLRILRACYFSGKLGFEIDDDTLSGMKNNKIHLRELSNQRLFEMAIKIIYARYDYGTKYIKDNNLLEYCPVYKRLFDIANKAYSIEELLSLYYHKYKEYPIEFPQIYSNIVYAVEEIVSSNFDNYTVYKNQNYFNTAFTLSKYLGINAHDAVMKFYNLEIKEDTDLAVSKYEISKHFRGRNISYAIKDIISLILDRKIKNTKEDIENKIKELVVKYEGANASIH